MFICPAAHYPHRAPARRLTQSFSLTVFCLLAGKGGGRTWRHCCGKSTRGRFVLIVGVLRMFWGLTSKGSVLAAFTEAVTRAAAAPRRGPTRTGGLIKDGKHSHLLTPGPGSRSFSPLEICNTDALRLRPAHTHTHTHNNLGLTFVPALCKLFIYQYSVKILHSSISLAFKI